MIPVPGMNATDTWPYIHGKSPEYKWERNESTSMCICNERWACKEGYEMCSEFLGCIPRFDVTVDDTTNQYVRSETEGYKGWIIWENPDAIIERTIKDNFDLYGKTSDNYLNQVWRYFDMESESCAAVGIADSFSIGGDAVTIPKSWTSTDTPRNPERLKQGFKRSTVVHSKSNIAEKHHALPGKRFVMAKIHRRSISSLQEKQEKEYANPLYRDFIEMKWQCTDFDYAENIAVHGAGSLSSATDIAFTTKGSTGYKTVSHLTRAKQKVNLGKNGEFDKFPIETHRLWSRKETESGNYGYDFKDSIEKSATTGSVHKMWIMPVFDDTEHHKSNISGTAHTIGLNGLRAIFSNDYKSVSFKSVPVRGCTGAPQNVDAEGKEQVRGEAMQEKGTCYDMYLTFGNPKLLTPTNNLYFTYPSDPFWVLTFGTTKYENLEAIPSSAVLVSNNLRARYAHPNEHAKVLGAASCRLGTSSSAKVLTNDAWAKLVSSYTADYKIKEVCDAIFSKFVKKQCMGGCLKSSDQESDDDRDFSNTGYWREFMDFVKLSGKCVGRHSDWKDSRLGPYGVDEKGGKTNKVDDGPSTSGTTWQGYADIWTYKTNSDIVIRSDNYVGSSLSSAKSALSEYGHRKNWPFERRKQHSTVYGYPHLQKWDKLKVSLSDSRLRSAYSQCPTARKYEAKVYSVWDDYAYKVENKCNGRGAWDNLGFVKANPPAKWWWYDRDKSSGRWSTYEGKGPFKYETKELNMRGGSDEYPWVFGPSTRYQFVNGAKIHIKYNWQTYRTFDDLNSGTIVPTPTNPYVHYVRMNEDVPAQSSDYCHYQVPNNVWLASDKDAVFVEKKSLGLNNPQNYWKLTKQKSKARQLVIRGDSFEFCRNDEEASEKCLCGRRSCDAGEWCYYRHFTSDTWKGDSFDLIGWCASRKLIPCESVDPSVPFTSSTKDIKARDDDCICGTEAINPAVPISIENIKPRWVYITNGPYMTCNFDLNVYGQGDTALEVPILGPPCSQIYGVRPNQRRCTCYTTKKNKLSVDDAMEHIYWSDFFEGQYCFQDDKRVEHVAFALVTEGFCDTYDKYSGQDTGPWTLVLNPNQCLEGSNRIDDKTLTINPKVRFTRSKHDQAGCSWDKGGWFLLFNDYRDSEMTCDDTYAEDPTRSGCICQLRGERCSAVHAEEALSLPAPFLNEHNRMQGGICLCGQKKCSDGKFCYEKLSGCENTNSFECNYSEEDNMCWPDGAQRIVTKVGVRRNVVYLVEPVPTTPQQTPVCPEGADGQKVNDFGPGDAAPQQCICGDAFKVLPTICDSGEYCHHRLNICYKEKQHLCPTNVFLTDADQCLCGLKKNKPSHLMNVYSELEEATEEPHDQAKFFKTVYCERSQLCVLRDYADSLDPDAMCLSGPVEACPDYPTANPHAVCRCSPKALAKEGQYCFKGEVRDELHPYCQDMHTDPSLTKYTLTNCYCPTSGHSRGIILTDGDNTYCDFRTNSLINNCGHGGNLKCATRRTIPAQICDDSVLLTSANTPNRCKCNGKLQSIVCMAGEMCGMLEGGLPKCYSSYIETCDATLSCVESLARADTCFCDGIQTETDSICTGAGIVKNPRCDRYESPYDVVKKDVYFHNFNQLQFGVQQQTFVIEDVVYGEEYDPLAYPGDVINVKNLKGDAPDWCDPLLAFDNPDHYDCLYLPTKADIESEVSVRIEWSTENEYLIPGESTVELKTSVDNVNNEISNCKSYRVTVNSNDYATGWENSDARSTILDSFECPNGFCITRKDTDDVCEGSNDCLKPEYEQCDLFGTSKRYFTWLKHSDVYEQAAAIDASGYASAYNSAFVVQDTDYIQSGMYTKNDLLEYSTEILMCTLEDIETKSANTVEFITEGTTAPHAFVFAFDGECTGTELRMYEGNGDNAGSANERRNKCAKACAEKKPSLSSTSWDDIDGQDITGFIVSPTSGRCYCEVPASQDCSKSLSSTYDRYDFIEPFYSWTVVDIEDRRSSIVVPVVEDGEQLLTCVVGLFSADIMQRKDPTPFEVTTVERRFMGGNPSMTHFNPTAIAVDVKAVSGAHDGACTALNNEENTGWMPIHHAFHRNPCNTILDRSNTYQLQNSVKNVERVEEQSVEYVESEQTCVFERIYETTAQIQKHVANGKCRYIRPLPEGWWAPRLHKSDPLAHSDPAQECARRCYSAYKSRAFTLKTSHGIPTWLDTHTGFESSAFTQNYAGSNFWDKFNSLQQQWENIPKATRHDECACAYDTCEEVTDELNILPIHKTNDVDPCFETFFPIFFSLHDDPIQQKLYFEKSFVRENVCDVGNPTDRFSKTYYSSYTIEAVPLSVISPQVTNIRAHFLDDKGHLATDNGGIVLQDIDFSKGWSAQNYYNNNIPKCAGDCDRDSHCASGLKCFQRSYGEDVPGCKPGGNRWLDLCYDPSDIGKPEFEAVEINGFSQVEQGMSTYLAQICVKYVPWCPVITENTRIEDINENMFECMCSTQAKKKTWEPNNPFWVYERQKIYKNEAKYCLQEPDTRKVMIDKMPCSAFNKTIEWSLAFDKSTLGIFPVENLQECYCGGDNGLYCGDTEFCMGDQNERVCQSLNQLVDKDVPVRVIEDGTCADMPGWEPVQDPLFCYAQRQLLLRPHGYEISTSDAQEEYTNYPDVSLLDDVKYARLGDVQDKHETDELYYGLTFQTGCSLSYISQVDDNVPFYKNEHLAPIKDPSTGEDVPITHRKYTGSWGERCAIPGLAEWYYETAANRYSTAYYSCDQPAEVGIWEEYTVRQNAFGTTRALPKLHSSDVNRVLGLYAKLGDDDFAAGEHTLEVNTRNVEYMQFSQIEDIPAEVYNIKYKQKKLCKLDRPLCSDVMAGNAYDSKYCIRSDGSVVDAGALQIPSGKTVPVLVQSGTCAQSAADIIDTAEQCGSRATELGYSSTVDVITEASGAEPFAVVSDDARGTALDYHKIFERGYPGLTLTGGTDKDSADQCAAHCVDQYKGFVFGKDGKCYCSAVKASTSSKTSDDRYTAYDFEEYAVSYAAYNAQRNDPTKASCAENGAEPITTAAECDAAGIAIGMVETSPKAGYTTLKNVNNWGPNGYCIKWGDDMYFNSHAVTDKCGHTGMLGAWSYGPCVCKTLGPKKIPQRFVYKGGGLCNGAIGIRVYNGASDNPGTDSTSNQIECAKACKSQSTALEYGPWSTRGAALGFSVDAVGRCYCNHKTWSGCSGSVAYANYGYSFYDFADRQVYTNPSSCPEGFYYQNGICTRLVAKSNSHYCDGGAWGQYVHETNYNTINYLMDPTECATRCSEYAASNQLGNVQKGQILRHYASNRVKGSSKKCFCHTIGYAPDGHCEDKNNLVPNSYYNTLVIDTVIPDTGDYTGISTQLAKSRCAQKCSRVDGFSTTNDGNCLCEEEGSSTSAYVDSTSFTRYKTNEALKYVDNHLRYIKIGVGYCSDWKYLPEGGYPAFLGKSSLLFSRDRTRECMNRCLDAYPGSEAFYMDADNKCGCSSGQCQSVRPSSASYYSYKITKCVGEGRLPDYSLKYSGSCERPVTSVEECEIAAVQLGLSDANIDTGSHQNINHAGLPYGCTQNPVSGDLYLNLNQATKTCGTSSHPCICRDEPVACPPGTFAFDRGSKCCRVNSDKNGNAINFYSPHCLDDNHIDCATGGYCVDENYGCPIANENADYILDKEHLATPGADVYEVELVKENAVCADSKYQSVVAIKEQSSLTTAEMAEKCKDACVHGQEAACDREPDCVNGQICQSISGHVIDNTGATMNDNAHPMRLDLSAWGGDANSLIFGEWSGNWLKMTRTNLQGVMQETRYTNSISSIGALTLSQWNAVASRSLTNVAGRTTCVSAHYCVKNVKFDCVGETERWSNFLDSQHSSQFLGDGYCLPDTSGTRKFVTDFKSCEGRCASEPNCNVFAWIDANDDQRVGASQCIINLDSTCESSADGSNDYPWKRYKINRKPSGKYYEISEGLCSDTGGENIEDVSECIQEAAHYVKDAFCTKNSGPTCDFGSNALDIASRPSGCYWYTGSGTEAIRFNSNVNSEPASIENKRICKKRVHGFLLKDDGKCVCTTGMADASNCVNDNAFSSYKINSVSGRHSTPPGCSKSGDDIQFNPFSSTATCDATNNCICTKPEYTVECPADEFPLDESESLEFCRCNGEELCSSDFAPYCLTNGKCVKNGKCIHDEALLAKCEGKDGWLRHPLDERENDICEEWFEQDTDKTRPRGGVTACGMVTCPRGQKYHEVLNACSNLNSNDFTVTAKLTEKTCADVSSVVTRGHYDCEKYNIGKNTEYIAFTNARSVDLPYGCSSISYMKDNVLRYIKSTFNQYDSRQVCSQKTPCFCAVEDMPACPINSVITQTCLCGSETEIILEGGMCKNNKAYATCFDTQQDIQLNWPCVCGQHLVVSKTFCSITEFESKIMQFSKYGADFEPLADTCHFQYSDIFVHVPRLPNRDAEILDLPNPHDSISSVLRTSGTRSIEKLTLENIMRDLNDLAASIKYANGSYTLGTENHTFAGVYNDEGLFCKGKVCYYGISGNYTATTVIEGFECKTEDYTVTNEVVESAIDCATVCGHTKECHMFSYNPSTNACKLEKTNTDECLEGWKPATFNTYKVGYSLEKKLPEDRICSDTLQFDKECKSAIQIQTESGKTIQLGSDQHKFSSPKELNFKGLFHTQEVGKVHYYIGEQGKKNCYEDPLILCGVSKHI